MEGLGLLLLSIVLIIIVGTIGTIVTTLIGIYQLISGLWNDKKPTTDVFKGVGEYFKNMAISVDMLGNVLLSPMWNTLMIKDTKIHPFGDPYETISDNLGENKKYDNLTGLGKWLSNLLNKLDRNHVERAIRPDFKKED